MELKKKKKKQMEECIFCLSICLSLSFPPWERQTGINGSSLLCSLLSVGWQCSRWWFKQWIYERHNLNVAERKEKDSHQTPLTNALANINALLIHPICCLIAFLYTVIWHLLLKSGAQRETGGGRDAESREMRKKVSLALLLSYFFPVMDARLWIMCQPCQCS